MKRVNISINSDSELGKLLAPGYNCKLTTPFGVINNLRTFMDFITTPNYPVRLLTKPKLTRDDINSIPKRKINIVNFWALVGYIVGNRILNDKNLINLLKENDGELTSRTTNKVTIMELTTITETLNVKLVKLVEIYKQYEKLIKEDNFNKESIIAYVNSIKVDKSKDIYHGVPDVKIWEEDR